MSAAQITLLVWWWKHRELVGMSLVPGSNTLHYGTGQLLGRWRAHYHYLKSWSWGGKDRLLLVLRESSLGVPGICSPQAFPPTPAGTRAGRHLGCQGCWPCGWLGLMAGPVAPRVHVDPGQGPDQISSSTMNKDESSNSSALSIQQAGGTAASTALSALTDHSGTDGRCSVPEVAGEIQEWLFWIGQHRPPDQAGLVSTAEEPDHPTMGCTVCCSGPGGAPACFWQDLQS